MTEKPNTGRDIAVLAGGIAAGVLGSRLLPPLFAALSGRLRSRKSEDPFDMLISDHRYILSLLDRMAAEPAGSSLKRGSLFVMLKRKLAKHALAEEDVVYPILHDESQGVHESKHLYDEHADMKILLFELERLVKAGEDWSEPVRALRELIQGHIREEESIVFPRLRQMLGEQRGGVVGGQIGREEALIL